MTQAADIIREADLIAPRLVHTPLGARLRRWGGGLILAGLFSWMCVNVDLTPEVLVKGVTKLGFFVRAMFPPTAEGAELAILHSLAVTFAMALTGTAAAIVIATPLGVLGAKTIVRNGAIHFVIRRLLDVFRGVPVLVWALIMISAFGLGPIAGVVALALADFPHLAKQFAEALENCDDRPAEGVRAAGGGGLHALRLGIAPQVIPVMASQSLYTLEGNFRNAAILGVVGAGGIGFELEERIRIFAFDQVAWIVIAYVLCVSALDWSSTRLRARLI